MKYEIISYCFKIIIFLLSLSSFMFDSVKNLKKIQTDFDKYQNNFIKKRKPEFFCLELNGEAGELANLEKKLWKGKVIDFNLVADEAADVFIALMNYCNSRELDLAKSVNLKLIKIETKRLDLKSKGEEY